MESCGRIGKHLGGISRVASIISTEKVQFQMMDLKMDFVNRFHIRDFFLPSEIMRIVGMG